MQIQDLPAEIRVRIFKHLDYRERIRIESVSPIWRAMALDTWKDQRIRILRFSREMLHLDEPWKDKKRIRSITDKLNMQQNEPFGRLFPINDEWTAKLLRNYELCHGRKEENGEDCPEKTNAGTSSDKYVERLKRGQPLAMREYWEIFTDPALYGQEKPSPLRQLAPLKAIVRRCAPFLEELHLHGDLQMRFGHIRIFFLLAHPFGRLAHLHIDVHLDSWHLRKIQRHLAAQLLSLAVVPISTDKSLIAFKELLANCNKLENLRIARMKHYLDLFDGHIEQRINGQPSSSLALTKSCCCSFMPSTLKCLLIFESHWTSNCEKLVNELLSLLAHCSQLCFMPVLYHAHHFNANIFQLIEAKSPREFDKIIRLQFPFFIAMFDSFPYIQRPEFRSLKALHVDFRIGAAEIRQIAKCCPQLEHLGILCWDGGGTLNPIIQIPDLMTLHQFQRLSSLEIFVYFEMICPDGEQADIAFLEILTGLDQIHPLRSLDFKPLSYNFQFAYASLSPDYLLKMIKQLKHLETFSCGFYLKNLDIDDMAGIGQFCEQLKEIFDSQEGANKKSFKFRLLANESEWDYSGRERKNLLVEWQKRGDTKTSKMNWKRMPFTGRELTYHEEQDFEPARSIVLNELITSQFGQRTSSMLFDSFGTMEGKEH